MLFHGNSLISLNQDRQMTGLWQDDRRSSKEITALALAAAADVMWDLVGILQCRGGEPEFRLAAQLAASLKPEERALGAKILGQLGCCDKPTYVAESVDILIPMLSDSDLGMRI
jgi:hypothetical protein